MKPTLWNKPSYLGLKLNSFSLCEETIQCHLQLCKISFIERLFRQKNTIIKNTILLKINQTLYAEKHLKQNT